MMKKIVAFVISLVILLSLFQAVPVRSAENLVGNYVVAELTHGNWSSTDQDSIENVPVEWNSQWFTQMSNPPDEGSPVVENPEIQWKTNLNFVCFNPDDPSFFTPDPSNGIYTWNFNGIMLKDSDNLPVSACEPDHIFTAKTHFKASRTVEPEILTENVTYQTVTFKFTLEEPLPSDVHLLQVGIGAVSIAYLNEPLIQTEFVSEIDVPGWDKTTGDLHSASWAINPANVELGKTYVFQAVLKIIKSPYLTTNPEYKPGAVVIYYHSVSKPETTSNSVSITDPNNLITATFKADNTVDWLPWYSDNRFDFWFNPVITEISPPHILIPANVRIEPETINLKNKGNITAFISLPDSYKVKDIDISSITCQDAEPKSSRIAGNTLILKFNTQEMKGLTAGDNVPITVKGSFNNGILFEGTDTVKVLEEHKGEQKGVLRIATTEPTDFWSYTNSSVPATIFANLIGVTPKANVYPDLLAEVPNVDDGTIQTNSDGTVTVIYRLKKNLKWSDGKPITSHDLYFTWKMMTDPDTQFIENLTAPFSNIISMETPDSLTAVTHWREGSSYLEMCELSIYPAHVLEPIYNNNPADVKTCSYSTNPVHAGPYKLYEWVPGDHITVVRNPYYYGKKPRISKVIFKFYTDKNQVINAVLNNEVDVVAPEINLSLTDMQTLQDSGIENNFYLKYPSTVYWEHLTLNLEDPILKDINLRKALMYALDRQELVDTIFDGKREVADDPINPLYSYYDPNITKYPYNPNKAKQILQDAGYTWDNSGALLDSSGNMIVINIEAVDEPIKRRLQEVNFIIQSWETNLGVTVNYVPMNWQPMIDSWYAGTFQASLFAWGSDPLSMCDYTLYNSSQIPTNENGMNGQNFTRISDPELDYWTQLCNESLDLQTRKEASYKIQEIVTDELPELYLNYWSVPLVVRKNIKGIHFPIYGSVALTWNIAEWSFGKP